MAGSPSSIVNVAFLRSGAEFSNTSNLSNPAQLSRSWDDLHERPVPNRQRKLDQFYDKTLGAVSQAVKEGLKPSPPVTRRTRCVSEGANDERQGGQSPASLVNLEFLRSGKEFSDPTKQSKAMNAEPIISPRQRLNQFHDQMLNAYATSKRTEAV